MDSRSIQKHIPPHGAWSTKSQARDVMLKDCRPKCLHDEGARFTGAHQGDFYKNQGKSFVVVFGFSSGDKALVAGFVEAERKRDSERSPWMGSPIEKTLLYGQLCDSVVSIVFTVEL